MMRALKNERGQELAELGITLILFLLLTLGVVEFGRMLMIVSIVTHAARDGARMAAVEPASNRNGSGFIIDDSGIVARVNEQIANVTAVTFTPTVTQDTQSGIPMVHVNVVANGAGVPWLFGPLLPVPANLAINRTVSFRDEGRS